MHDPPLKMYICIFRFILHPSSFTYITLPIKVSLNPLCHRETRRKKEGEAGDKRERRGLNRLKKERENKGKTWEEEEEQDETQM